jgi:hypothetical protein
VLIGISFGKAGSYALSRSGIAFRISWSSRKIPDSGKQAVEGRSPFCYYNEAFQGPEMAKVLNMCLGKLR